MAGPTFSIGDRSVGTGHPCFVVGEVAQAHDGSLGAAHAYIDAIAAAGADAVKFQTHIAAAESTAAEPWRVKFSRQDATRFDYWKRMEFTPEQWAGLRQHAMDKKLVFLSSPFSIEAMRLLTALDVPAWKVGAGEITNLPLIRAMAQTRRPVLLSSGMCTWEELDDAVGCARKEGSDVGVYQCTTAYPCPPESLGLNVMPELRARYGCPVGLSDHSGTIFAGLAAASLGANLLEVHVVFARECFGPDTPASVTVPELSQLMTGIRFIDKALSNPVDKEANAAKLQALRNTFGKSLVATRALPAGLVLGDAEITLKKPGTGLPAKKLEAVLGRKLRRALAADEQVKEEDLE